jgi:TRAP-type C4-dicarboxylate transport system permease large subunit
MNVYIISSMAKDTPMKETFIGIGPFLLSDLLRTALLVFVPGLALIALKL